MSLIVAKNEGVTVFTVTSNPKSKWPLCCQLLGTLCCSPFFFRSQSMKQQLGSSYTVLGTLQIIVGMVNLGFGGLIQGVSIYSVLWSASFWLGGVFVAAGIICIIVEKFPSPCMMIFSVLVNLVSFGLAITAIVLYSVALSSAVNTNFCGRPYGYNDTFQAPDLICEHYSQTYKSLYGGLVIMMIVLNVLQLCVTVSSCVVGLCKMRKEDKMKDPELQKPLLVEEVLSSPAC